jgi:sphingosine-1-phosphate phosphatase 1
LFLFIQIGNYLWNLVFHLGSQMGDETFYCLFFAFWFWNIDGAVGRRVMLTWTFIMYFGQVRLRAR